MLAISVQKKIPELVPLLKNSSSSQEFFDAHLSRKRHRVYHSIVGNLQNYILAATEQAAVESLVGPIEQVYRFHRLLVGEQLIHSKSYRSMTRRNNYTVEFEPGSGNPSSCFKSRLISGSGYPSPCFISRLICSVQILQFQMNIYIYVHHHWPTLNKIIILHGYLTFCPFTLASRLLSSPPMVAMVLQRLTAKRVHQKN